MNNLRTMLEELCKEMKLKIRDIEEHCASTLYGDFDDPSSGYSEMLHAEATTHNTSSVRSAFQKKADKVVCEWLSGKDQSDSDQLINEMRKEIGV